MSEWISVKDRLPEIRDDDEDDWRCSDMVIVVCGRGLIKGPRLLSWVGYCYPDGTWYDATGKQKNFPLQVEYWQPLPTPPEVTL